MAQPTGDTPTPERGWAEVAASDPADWPLGRLLSAAARRVEREWNAHLGGWELNHASFPVLIMLSEGPHTQTELAAACEVTEQTMSRVLDRMERTGHVVRTPHRTDRRKHRVEITDRGRESVVLASRTEDADRIAARGLTEDQVRELRALLAVVVRPG